MGNILNWKRKKGVSPAPAKAAARIAANRQQGLAVDQFLYFYLRLRKSEIRRIVDKAKKLYPGETPKQLARRLINTQCALSFLGGGILHLPQLIPVAGNVLKFAGLAGGASVLTRMHLYLILEIALLYGHDIEDQDRVAEMMAVVAASGITAAAPFVVNSLNWHPLVAIPASGLTSTIVTQLIGAAAISLYEAKTIGRPVPTGSPAAVVPAQS